MDQSQHANLVEKSKDIVMHSHLSGSDKRLVVGRIPFVAEPVLRMFVEVCEEDPFGVDAVVRSLKRKLEAQGNLKKLHEIVKQERLDVDALLNAHAL